jgi:hypothetical protein
MTSLTLLDAVGAPAWAFRDLIITIILAPFVFAFGMVLFFRLLDRYSKRNDVTVEQPLKKK